VGKLSPADRLGRTVVRGRGASTTDIRREDTGSPDRAREAIEGTVAAGYASWPGIRGAS
jgi:hypothetical protein